jgi:hypothetical protein
MNRSDQRFDSFKRRLISQFEHQTSIYPHMLNICSEFKVGSDVAAGHPLRGFRCLLGGKEGMPEVATTTLERARLALLSALSSITILL